jgi:carboxylesterase type B
MFWIHGGALTSGSGSDPIFDGGNMASRGDVVLVTINYRLGALGFLALNDGITNGNFGLADQIVALEWVREHIADFGGDPERITIFGQSAGAASVRALLASPKAKGKFAAAIMMSNLAGFGYAKTFSEYYTILEEVTVAAEPLLNKTGCLSARNQLDCLRALDPHVLGSLSATTGPRYLVVDGTYLVSKRLDLSSPGSAASVPILMGIMRDDGAAFIPYPTTTDVTGALTAAYANNVTEIVKSGLFPLPMGANATLDVFNVTARVATDGELRCLDQSTAYVGLRNKV